MNRFILFLFILVVNSFSAVNAQNTQYHRARIDLKDKNPLLLLRAGIPVDHGKMAVGRYFESDFSNEEINLIEKMGFKVNVLIRDVETYYGNPNRPSELTEYTQVLRDFDCKQTLAEIKTPFNYFEGSMGGYFTYDEMLFILDWMGDLYPFMVTKPDTIKGYTTHDGNVIHYVKVSDFPEVDENEPELLYTALHHAREPNSLSQMIFYLWYLMENYTRDPEIKYLVDHTEMYFIPCLNPDGYIINEKNKPDGGGLWRKNGKKDNTGKLVGVDLNRNYGYEWAYDNEGSSPNPGSETYRGESGFSEPETSALREFCVSRQFLLALNFHTFGNLLIHPWGYNDQPTDEDKIFKAMGTVMTRTNAFKMGTGTETVGYTTNGDSDDYLYGDEVEKNKIYSYTPEVGPSFWPAKTDIDLINKSCLEMNLALPRLALGWVDHEIYDLSTMHMADDTFNLHFIRPGFGNTPVDISISLNAEMDEDVFRFTFDKAQGGDTIMAFPYLLDTADLVPGRNQVWMHIDKNYGSFVHHDSIQVDVFYGDIKKHFEDKGSNTAQWQVLDGNWGVTPAIYTSAPTSITDSPSSSYARLATTTLRMANPVDLTDANSPLLTFNARWSIESGYDYGMVYAYTLAGDTLFLCGKYTRPGTTDQKLGYPVYDGIQEQWITEVIDLSHFEGESQVFIDFEITSDAFLELDGWYIDDVQVLSFKPITTSVKEEESQTQNIYPNPGSGLFTFSEMPASHVRVYNAQGLWVSTVSASHQKTIDLQALVPGIYHLDWTNQQGEQVMQRVAVIR
ncbi:MAG: immune inhibitor A [Saprospiraceae bacterium]|nr:immune inhibitor A [Saprospiraceae bacterium]